MEKFKRLKGREEKAHRIIHRFSGENHELTCKFKRLKGRGEKAHRIIHRFSGENHELTCIEYTK